MRRLVQLMGARTFLGIVFLGFVVVSALSFAAEEPTKRVGGVLFIPQYEAKGTVVEWVLSTHASEGHHDFKFQGIPFLKVGTATILHQRELSWLKGKVNALGIVYSVGKERLFQKIEKVQLTRVDRKLPSIANFSDELFEIQIVVNEVAYPLYISHAVNNDNGEFLWTYLDKSTQQPKVISLAGAEVVPQGYVPLTFLRVRGLEGYLPEDACPQLNSQMMRILTEYQRDYLALKKLAFSKPSKKRVGDPLILSKKTAITHDIIGQKRVILLGNGSCRLAQNSAADTVRNITFLRSNPQIVVEKVSQQTWNSRAESIKPHRLF